MATPPTTEKGKPSQTSGSLGAGLLSWRGIIDDREFAPDLRYPKSVQVYERVETDAQAKGLLMATTLPVRRLLWEIDPNGARPEVVEHIAGSLKLPIKGEDPPPKRARGFNHDKHLAHALRAVVFGHYYFEQVFDVDTLVRLRKLATRPPRTIDSIVTDDDGGLAGIRQRVGLGGGGGLASAGVQGPVLGVNRLLAYIWDSQDDGDWVGRSMLRACYKHWLVKDVLIRVDATKHERNAMGIPWFEVDPAASQSQIDDLAAVAERMRAGEQSGGAGPGKLSIKGVEGSLPDTIGSIRYHDQQMSRSFLAMFMDLGTTETGARSLGESFIDFFIQGQDAIADWYAETTQAHQIEDEVEWNWGPDEQPPALIYTRRETSELAISDLTTAVSSGLIAVDDELASYISRRWKLPFTVDLRQPSEPEPTPQPEPESEPTSPVSARAAMGNKLRAALTAPMRWPDLARAVGAHPKNGTARRARDELLASGAIRRVDGVKLAPSAEVAIDLPDRDLRRQPYDFEVQAAVDFAAMDATFEDARESLVEAINEAQADQIDTLVAAVEDAGGDAAKLASLSVDPIPAGMIADHLRDVAREGEASAKTERDSQLGGAAARAPVKAAQADQGAIAQTVEERAAALALTLAAAIAASASKRAAAVSTMAPAAAAEAVRTHLTSLSGAVVEEQAGGAVHQSYAAGRKEFMRANEPQYVYASELLDTNTCQPCTSVDGTEWPTVADAEAEAYPVGGYVDCEGGLRCRGILVATYV